MTTRAAASGLAVDLDVPDSERGPAELVSMRSENVRFPHFRNLDVLRLLAAASVVFSHGFVIAQETEANEPFKKMGVEILGLYGVFTFFIISGILVTESARVKPGTTGLLWRRGLRIIPGFLVCNILVMSILGLFFYPTGGLIGFVRHDFGDIVKHLLFLDTSGWLDGVRMYAHRADSSESEFNGSLWTLQQELLCYGLLAVLAAARWIKPVMLGALVIGATALFGFKHFGPNDYFENFLYSLPSFASGMFAWWLLHHHKPRLSLVAVCVAALAIAFVTHKLKYAFPPFAAYIVLYVATVAPFDLRIPKWIGDISYGTYLYGWPAEEAVKIAGGGHASVQAVIGFGLLGALACGYLSWWLVEKPALRLKGLVPPGWSPETQALVWWRALRTRGRMGGVGAPANPLAE